MQTCFLNFAFLGGRHFVTWFAFLKSAISGRFWMLGMIYFKKNKINLSEGPFPKLLTQNPQKDEKHQQIKKCLSKTIFISFTNPRLHKHGNFQKLSKPLEPSVKASQAHRIRIRNIYWHGLSYIMTGKN
jgi:hypothetical protein